jgi:hypothetical protein
MDYTALPLKKMVEAMFPADAAVPPSVVETMLAVLPEDEIDELLGLIKKGEAPTLAVHEKFIRNRYLVRLKRGARTAGQVRLRVFRQSLQRRIVALAAGDAPRHAAEEDVLRLWLKAYEYELRRRAAEAKAKKGPGL